MSKKEVLPFNVRVEKAKNEIRQAVNVVSETHDLPLEIIALILESALSEVNQEKISTICEQITGTDDEEKEKKGE